MKNGTQWFRRTLLSSVLARQHLFGDYLTLVYQMAPNRGLIKRKNRLPKEQQAGANGLKQTIRFTMAHVARRAVFDVSVGKCVDSLEDRKFLDSCEAEFGGTISTFPGRDSIAL